MTTLADLRDWDGAYMNLVDDLVHVHPLFGKPHEISVDCWCRPTVEGGVAVHEPDH